MFLYNCDNVSLLRTLLFSKSILQIVFTLIPIILIVFIAIDIVKMVIGKEEDFKKIPILILKRIVAVVILFFVPFFVTLALSKIGEINDNKLACYDEATIENIQRLEKQAADDIISKVNNGEITLADINSLTKAISKITDKSIKEEYEQKLEEIKEKYNKQEQEKATKEEQERKEKKSNQKYTKTLFIGDSRTVGMCAAVTLKSGEDCSIAKGSTEYDWFNNTALPKIKAKLSIDQKYNVIINMGTNDLGLLSNANKYASRYNELKKSYPNANIIIVSIGLVKERDVTAYKDVVTNSNVNKFNNIIKQNINSSVKYCDINSKVNYSYPKGDGVHYDNETYKKIYQELNNCI